MVFIVFGYIQSEIKIAYLVGYIYKEWFNLIYLQIRTTRPNLDPSYYWRKTFF